MPRYHRFVVEFDAPVRFNPTDQIRNRGFFYIDVYGLENTYNEKLWTVNDNALRYIQSKCYPDQGVLRFVFYVKSSNSTFQVNQVQNPFRLVIDTVAAETGKLNDIRITDDDLNRQSARGTSEISLSISGQMPRAPGSAKVNLPEPRFKGSWGKTGNIKTVIIDPGHGGENSGARSNTPVNGQTIQEKDVCLQFAYHLKKLIDATPNMVALLTRTDDSNISLQDRVVTAKEFQGDYFISLHMNDGNGNNAARGMEVYYLNTSGVMSEHEKAVAERENKDIGKTVKRSDKPLVLNVLSDLDKYNLEKMQRESMEACNRLHAAMTTYPTFRTHSRGVKSAAFVVLKNELMPAVLLEVGFMTNSEDLKYLVNPRFQQATAVLIYNGLCDYFAEVDPKFKAQRMKVDAMVAGQ